MSLKICAIAPDSIAEELELEAGDEVLSVNGHSIDDYIAFSFHTADDEFTIEVQKPDGEVWQLEIEREYGESLGIQFESPVSRTKLCTNRCLFCFVEQAPPALRPSLNIKDDDFRLSFLHGNFVTLTNLSRAEWQRILDERLSPLYVSIHATDPDVRSRMMGNQRAGLIMDQLRQLAEVGIVVHGQIVMCPGINDGEVLDQTLDDLEGLGDSIGSVAVVPVGLTGYRDSLTAIPPVDKDSAIRTIEQIERRQQRLLTERETRWVWAADEFYLSANIELPPYETYEVFPQIENGVGLSTTFLKEFADAAATLPESLKRERRVSVATSRSGARVLARPIETLNRIAGLEIKLWEVPNRFFGGMVSVAGLLTGSDFIDFFRGQDIGEVLYIPAVCLKDKRVFLDEKTLDDLTEAIRVPTVPLEGAEELVKRMICNA